MIKRVSRNVPLIIAASFAVLSMVALGLALAFRAADQRRIDELGSETHTALCAFKADLERRAASTREILDENPGDPVHVFGLDVPRDELVSNLTNQQRSLKALAALDCE